jgi:hypothetical protein
MLDEVVKKEKLSNNNYYVLFDNCSDELKEHFISNKLCYKQFPFLRNNFEHKFITIIMTYIKCT